MTHGRPAVCVFCFLLPPLRRDPQQPPLSVSGPLWVGPLQDRAHLEHMLQLAEQRGWAGRDGVALPWTKKGGVRSLGELLSLLVAESDSRLPPWWVGSGSVCGGCAGGDAGSNAAPDVADVGF